MEKLYIPKKEGEELPARRRRIARAITDLLSENDLLRQEVAHMLALSPELIDYMNRHNSQLNDGIHGADDEKLEEC